jgi:hypothetical protein
MEALQQASRAASPDWNRMTEGSQRIISKKKLWGLKKDLVDNVKCLPR